MGISGLLPCLRSVEEPCHISAYKGKRAGVDTYCWLHKLCRGNARELLTGQACTEYIHKMVQRVELFIRHGVAPVMVFDGADIPLKSHTNGDRRGKRAAALAKAAALERQGRFVDARAEYGGALDITSEIAQSLVRVLKEMGVECIVAPYEADAQLAYLAHAGYIDVVVTEDSDLLAYRTPEVLLKVDHAGHGVLLRAARMGYATELSLASFDGDMLLTNLIMAGCDYTPSLRGIGIKKANKLVAEHRTVTKILEVIQTDPKYATSAAENLAAYEYDFLKSFFAFRHHIVFDVRAGRMTHFTDINPAVPLDPAWVASVLGALHPPETATALCRQHSLCPQTLRPFPADSPALRNADAYLQKVSNMRAARGTPFSRVSAAAAAAATATATAQQQQPQQQGEEGGDGGDDDAEEPQPLNLSPPQFVCLGGRPAPATSATAAAAAAVPPVVRTKVAPPPPPRLAGAPASLEMLGGDEDDAEAAAAGREPVAAAKARFFAEEVVAASAAVPPSHHRLTEAAVDAASAAAAATPVEVVEPSSWPPRKRATPPAAALTAAAAASAAADPAKRRRRTATEESLDACEPLRRVRSADKAPPPPPPPLPPAPTRTLCPHGVCAVLHSVFDTRCLVPAAAPSPPPPALKSILKARTRGGGVGGSPLPLAVASNEPRFAAATAVEDADADDGEEAASGGGVLIPRTAAVPPPQLPLAPSAGGHRRTPAATAAAAVLGDGLSSAALEELRGYRGGGGGLRAAGGGAGGALDFADILAARKRGAAAAASGGRVLNDVSPLLLRPAAAAAAAAAAGSSSDSRASSSSLASSAGRMAVLGTAGRRRVPKQEEEGTEGGEQGQTSTPVRPSTTTDAMRFISTCL